MYQVTLENVNGECWTVTPPCYGFMRRGMADRSTIACSPGLAGNGSGAFSMYPHDAVPFNQLKYIWNSGTHINDAGYNENPEFNRECAINRNNLRYLPRPIEEGQLRSRLTNPGTGIKDFIREAAVKLRLSEEVFPADRDYIDELLDIERYMDSESNSIVTRHPMARDLFGVKVDDSVPADRALNYLMIARLFTTGEGRSMAYMHGRYVKGLTPAQAIIFACILSMSTDWNNVTSFTWIACSNDSCIYPSYMLACGVGALYAEPTQVVWRQTCYNEMGRGGVPVGHQREGDCPRLRVKEQRTGVVRESLGAMFMAIFSHRSLAMNWKVIPMAMIDTYAPQSAAELRVRQSGRADASDVHTSSYAQPSSTVYNYAEHVRNGCRAANIAFDDAVIAMMNNPLAQPAA